eukprot:7325801-Prymnesium_polylepis.1
MRPYRDIDIRSLDQSLAARSASEGALRWRTTVWVSTWSTNNPHETAIKGRGAGSREAATSPGRSPGAAVLLWQAGGRDRPTAMQLAPFAQQDDPQTPPSTPNRRGGLRR